MFFAALLIFLSVFTREDTPAYGFIQGIVSPSEIVDSRDSLRIPIKAYNAPPPLAHNRASDFSYAINQNINDGKYYISSIDTTDTDKNEIELEFDGIQIVGSILYFPAYKTYRPSPERSFDGFPTTLNVYSSTNESIPYELKYTIQSPGRYTSPDSSVLMQFPRPIICSKLKLEFVEVTQLASFTGLEQYRYAVILDLYILKNTTEYPYFPARQATDNPASSTNAIGQNDCTTITAGDQANHGKDLIFATGLTFWAGSELNTPTFKNYFIFELNKMTSIESIDYGPAYSTSQNSPYYRRYDGYPTVLSIYTSSDNELRNEPNYIYYGLPVTNASDKADLWDAIHIQFPKPIWCTRIKLEFEEITIDASFGNKLTPSAQFIHLRKTPSAQIKPPDERVDKENEIESSRNLTISGTTFTDFQSTHDYGGAVRLININTQITQVTFTRCTSNIAGGAIYIDTKVSTEHQNSLEGLTFNNCGSQSGGAVCIIATFENDFTSIVDCTFTDNTATQGSAIYLAAKHGQVKACRFSSNTGSSIIKYAATGPSSSRILTSSNLIISDCSFEDDIKEGSFYIDVDETLDSKGISLKDNKFKSNDTQQTIKINQSPVKQETKSKSSLLLTILVPTLCVISLLLIIFIIVAHKNKDQQSEQEENHNEELTQDEV